MDALKDAPTLHSDAPRRVPQTGAWTRGLRALVIGMLAGACGCASAPPRIVSPEQTADGVVFRYRDPVAQVVQLSGSWETNFDLRGRDWTSNTRVGRMRRGKDGVWELRVPLGPGRYEYVFLVDGRFWRLDPDNPQRSPDGAHGWVSLLVVP